MRATARATSPRRAGSSTIGGVRRLVRCRRSWRRTILPMQAQPAVMRVDALDHHRGEMLEFEGEGALHPHHQGAGLRPPLRITAGTARPFELDRLAGSGEPGADDVRPRGEDVGGGESLRGKRRADTALDQFAERFDARHRHPGTQGPHGRRAPPANLSEKRPARESEAGMPCR